MPKLSCSRASLAALLPALALSLSAGSGYLPVVGPKPLRFDTPPDPAAEKTTLPPLVMREEEPAVTNDNQPPVAAPSAASSPVPAAKTETASPPPTVSEPPPQAGSDTNFMTPQMLLRYFNQSPANTNRSGPAIFVPAGIAPVPSAPPASSSATYSTSP